MRIPDTAKRLVVNVCRMAVALTFIFSGFVKAVDPIGTQYKLTDYLDVWQLSQYVPDIVTLGASVVLSAVEFCLGVMLLFAIHRRTVAKLVLLFMSVMTALTLWLAVANPISDCGCFGDAVKLTNWQTFGKNVVLLMAAIVIAWRPACMARFVSLSNQWVVSNYTVVFILAISAYSLYALPEFDFRPYHIGANIRKGMEIPEGAPQPQFETTFTLEKDGVRKDFNIDNYPDSTWTFIDSKTVQTAEGYVPPIHDFSIVRQTDGTDITDSVLSDKGYTFLLVAPYLEKADDSRLDLINQLHEYAEDNGYPFYCLTASGDKGTARWKELTGADYPFCTTDATTLQTIIRSNPGVLLLKNGTIIRKWGHNQLPDESQLNGRLDDIEIGQMPQDTTARKILYIIMWYVMPLTVLAIADRLWAWSLWIRTKEKQETNKINQLFKRKKRQ